MWGLEFEEADHFERPDLIEGVVVRNTVRAGSLCAAVNALLFSGLYLLRGPAELAMPNFVASLAFGLIAAIRMRNATIGLYSALTIGLLLFGYQLLLLGRIDNGIAVFFLVPNVAATLLGLRNLARYCGAITFIELAGVVVGARLGWFPVGRVRLPEPDIVMAASMIATLVLCGLFALITRRARQRVTVELVARNGELAAALEETRIARNEAVEASLAKERFFANLTHEIRTPLNGIAGTVELLQQTPRSAEQQPLADALSVSTRNLVELVNTILDHAKIAAGHTKIERAPVSIRHLAQELLETFGARAAEKEIALNVVVAQESPDWIESDAVKIKEIVGNLISNAVKFTSRGSVEVSLQCDGPAVPPEKVRLIAEVVDTGVGILPERLEAMFEPFVQGDQSITRVYGGTGLGLSIARQLAGLLGGTLRAKSLPGEGSTFTLELPVLLADAPAPKPDRQTPREMSLAGLRVLLAEDNPINQLVARKMLETAAAEVGIASDGLQAVEMASKERYHVILMDLQMPGMDGIAATREIRQREQHTARRPIPIIAMTGNSADDYGEACRQSGMDGFLTKPVTLKQLTSELGRLDLAFGPPEAKDRP